MWGFVGLRTGFQVNLLRGAEMWTIFFKVSIEFVTILLLFYVFGLLAMRHVGS